MDSDDDMLDPMGDYYSADDSVDVDEEDDYAYPDHDDEAVEPRVNSFTVLKEADIRRRQEADIAEVSAVLSVSRVAATILLRHHHWSVSELHEAWFADEDRVRKAVGLPENPPAKSEVKKMIDCGICFESYPRESIISASCQHPFCKECWGGYISTSIESGPGCLSLRCPEPSCKIAISEDMIDSLVLEKYKKKFASYLIRSYVEENRNRKIKWCPAPGCEYAVELDAKNEEGFDVTCECSYGFCWNCNEEAHRPVDCETVAKWIAKNSSEAENTNWILANSKPCPKCRRPIEKNHGCMHMTCRPPCSYHFCWLCLDDWNVHGYKPCNKFAEIQKTDAFNEAERRRVMAKNSIVKYTHYYERWAENHSSRQKAIASLHAMESEKIVRLSETQSTPETQLKFVIDAWLQIIECRRVLKWTYAYGYYLPEEETAKKQFFEYSQGEAEAGLERLHGCAEKELEPYLKDDSNKDSFNEFRTKLIGLTKVTGTYFENLVRALANGLQEVSAQEGCSKTAANSVSTKKKRRVK